MKLVTTLFAGACAAALWTAPAHAQFTERTIRVSNGVNQDHPVGNGVVLQVPQLMLLQCVDLEHKQTYKIKHNC